jgi:hypothetical protein
VASTASMLSGRGSPDSTQSSCRDGVVVEWETWPRDLEADARKKESELRSDWQAEAYPTGPGNRGQTGLPANFRQKAPEIHGSLVSPRRAPSPEGQFFMKFRRPKAHPNRQPVSGKLRRKLGVSRRYEGAHTDRHFRKSLAV